MMIEAGRAEESSRRVSEIARDRECECGRLHWRPDLRSTCVSCELATATRLRAATAEPLMLPVTE